MTKRNIAIADFSPKEVEGSSWPRFTGWKMIGKPVLESGLFGLVDSDTRMHRFFKDTTLEEVLATKLSYTYSARVSCLPMSIDFFEGQNGGDIIMPPIRDNMDFTIRWLPPYQYIDKDDVEWDVYVVITGADIYINGDFHRIFKSEGYWDMQIWKPRLAIGEQWNDIKSIEQSTINYVVTHGYTAQTKDYAASSEQGKLVYRTVDVTQDIPGYQA